MTDFPALITATTGGLVAAGGGIAWLWRIIEKRFAAVEVKLTACEERERKHQENAATHLTIIELLFLEVRRRSRGAENDVLTRAKELLDDVRKKQDDKK